jgi:hypothetical protein
MVYSILPVPFASAARQRQYEALHAALAADPDAPPTVLLGNLAAFSTIEADALVVRPSGLALVVLTPRGGHLTMPALAYGTWQLDGQPLPGREGADNPFAQYQQQLPTALGWLSEQLPAEGPLAQVGLALFESPLTFGPEVEAHLHHHPAAQDFHLLAGTAQVPTRLRQLLDSQPVALAEEELLDWADYLAAGLPTAGEPTNGPSPAHYLGQKLRQLWSWLGAEDIPEDPPYGGTPLLPDPALRDQQEQARLHQLRQELLAELAQQRQEAAAREATRTQELAQLRQQLAQAGQSAAERQAEQEAKAALEDSLRTARTELARRNQELDARIGQLGQLIEQLHKPTPAASAEQLISIPRSAPARMATRSTPPKPAYRRLQQVERWGLVALATGILGAGGFGLTRWLHQPKGQSLTTAPRRAARAYQPADAENQASAPVIIYDTLAVPTQPEGDLGATRSPLPADDETIATPTLTTSDTPLHVDSTTLISEPAHVAAPADSTTASPTP